jgi:hypothetical protein
MADVVEVLLRVRTDGSDDVQKLGERAARAAAGVDDLEEQLDDVGDAGEKAGKGTKKAGDAAEKAGQQSKLSAAGIAAMVTGLATAITFAVRAGRAFADMAQDVLDSSNELADASARTDVYVTSLAGLRLAARGSGQDFNALAAGLNALPKRISDAAAGVGDAKRGFDALGISLRDTNGDVKSTDAVLREVAIAITDTGAKSADVATALGKNFGPRLKQALAGATGGLEDFIAAVEQTGSTSAVDLTGQLQRGIGLTQEAVSGLTASVLAAIGGEQGIAGVLDVVLRVIEGVKVALVSFAGRVHDALAAAQVAIAAFGDGLAAVAAVARPVTDAIALAFSSLADTISGAFGAVFDSIATALEALLDTLSAALQTILEGTGGVFESLGLSDEADRAAKAAGRVASNFATGAQAVVDLRNALVDLSRPLGFALEGVTAAATLDTSALLRTLGSDGQGGSGDGPGGSGDGSGALTIDDKLFAASLVEALRVVETRLGPEALEAFGGAGFSLDRFLLEIAGATSRAEVDALTGQVGGATGVAELQALAARLGEVDAVLAGFGDEFSTVEQTLAAQTLGIGDSGEDLAAALQAAAVAGDESFAAFASQAQVALEAADALVEAQAATTAAYRDAARQLDSAGRSLFETAFGDDLKSRQQEVARLRGLGTADSIARANTLQGQTTAQIGDVLAAQTLAAPLQRAAEGFETAVNGFSTVASSFGSLLLGDVAGSLSTLTSGIGGAAESFGAVGGAALGAYIGTVVFPGLGTAAGAAIGQIGGGLIGGAVSGVLDSVSSSIGAITKLGQLGAGGVADTLDGFLSDLLAGLDALPVVIEKVLPSFFRALSRELPPVLISTFRELARLFAETMRELPTILSNAFFMAVRMGVSLLVRAITTVLNRALGTSFETPALEGSPLGRGEGSDAGRAAGAGVGALLGSVAGPGGSLLGAAVGARLGDRVAGFAENAQDRGFSNFRRGLGSPITVNGFVGESRDDLARYLQDLLGGDARFGFSL